MDFEKKKIVTFSGTGTSNKGAWVQTSQFNPPHFLFPYPLPLGAFISHPYASIVSPPLN